MHRFSRRGLNPAAVAALVLSLLWGEASTVAAQQWDPAAAVAAYAAALNAHDVDGGMALFDEYGSATDASGHHFEGRDALREFLLASGFGSPDASVTTEHLFTVANKAVWTYACSCSTASTEVRLVMNHDKISVFSMMAGQSPPAVQRTPSAGSAPWLIGLGALAAVLAVGLQVNGRRGRPGAVAPRPSQGRLIAALTLYRPGGAASERVELPAAAITSFSDSDDSAAPCSR